MTVENQNRFLESLEIKGIFCPNPSRPIVLGHQHLTFKKGQFVYQIEDASDRIYYILDGRIRIGAASGITKELTKSILTKGEIFGEKAIIGESTRRDFAEAVENTTVCSIAVDHLRELMKEDTGLHLQMMKLVGSRMIEIENRLESLVLKDSRTRVIEFLHSLARLKGQRIGYEMLVRGFMTHQEIAHMTATSRQTVTTILNELRNRNVITFNRRRLLVRDMSALIKSVTPG